MLAIPSSLHDRCCNIECVLSEIDAYVVNLANKQLVKTKYAMVVSVRYQDYYDLITYREILLDWAHGNKAYDTNFQTIMSNIKRILNK